LLLVSHLAEVDGRQIFDGRFNDFHESVFVLMHCQQEDNTTILRQ
jgi:hypothetical protein